jgi:hypothetical protein
MTRKLTRLRVDEISSVDKAANDGARIVLMKRHSNASHRERLRNIFEAVDFSKVKFAPPPEDDVDDEDKELEEEQDALSPQLEQYVSALLTANPNLSRQDVVNFLLYTAHGRTLATHMSTITTTKRKETTMDRTEQLQSIVKQHGGVHAMAKLFVAANKAFGGVTEAEFTKLIDDEAQKTRMAGERPASAFARYYSAPENLELRKAIQITKNVSLEPVQVGGADAMDVDTDRSKAMLQLQALAEQQRQRSPTLTPAQAFERVFTDQANAELAARAHRRPAMTTNYSFPYQVTVDV